MNAATSRLCVQRAGPGLELCRTLLVPNSFALSSRLFFGTPACHIPRFCFHLLWPSWVEIGALYGKLWEERPPVSRVTLNYYNMYHSYMPKVFNQVACLVSRQL